MTDDYKLQVSVSIPHSDSDYAKADMVNIRANDPHELESYLRAFSENPQLISLAADAAANLRAAYLVAKSLGGTPVQRSQNAPQGGYQPQGGQNPQQGGYAPQNGSQQFQGQAQSQGGYQGGQQQSSNDGLPTSPPPGVGAPPSCSHGVKGFKAGKYKNGKPGYWMAWTCPAQRGDQTQHGLQFIDQG